VNIKNEFDTCLQIAAFYVVRKMKNFFNHSPMTTRLQVRNMLGAKTGNAKPPLEIFGVMLMADEPLI